MHVDSRHRRLFALAVVVAVCSTGRVASAEDTHCDRAQALRKASRLIEAREQLCPDQLCRGDEHPECAGLLPALDREIPTITFNLDDANGMALPGATVALDGQLVRRAGLGAVLLDPGKHDVFVHVDGRPPVDTQIVVSSGEESHVNVRDFLPSSRGGNVSHEHGRDWRPLGYAAGVVGLVSIGAGIAFVSQALSKTCGETGSSCGPQGVEADVSRQRLDRDLAIGGFALGGALLAGGIGIVLFGPNGRESSVATVRVSPLIRTGEGGFTVVGSF